MYQNPSQQAYGIGVGTTGTNGTILDNRDPTANDVFYRIGQFWQNTQEVRLWYLNSLSNATGQLQATWEIISVEGVLNTLSDTDNTHIVSPSGSTDTPPFNIEFIGGDGIEVVGDNTAHTITITNTGTGSETITGNTGGAVGPDETGTIFVLGGTTAYVVGVPEFNTLNIEVVATNHALIVGRGAATPVVDLAVGDTNTVLLGNTGADPSFGQVPNAALVHSTITLSNGNNITVTGSPVALGGTASFNLTGTTNHAVQVGNAGGSLTSIGLGTAGQVLTSNGSANPSFQDPASSAVTSVTGDTATGINVSPITGACVVFGIPSTYTTLGVASFNIGQFSVVDGAVSLLGTVTFPWTDEATNFNAASNNGYFCTASLTATLPASPSQGDIIRIVVDTTGIVTILANTGQKIRLGNVLSAAAGAAQNTMRGDAMELVYRSSDTTWINFGSPVGGWNIT